MLQIHRSTRESLIIGNKIQVVDIAVEETEVWLALIGVEGRSLEFVLDRSSTRPDVSGLNVKQVRVRVFH